MGAASALAVGTTFVDRLRRVVFEGEAVTFENDRASDADQTLIQ